MKVREMIEELGKYNPDADLLIIAEDCPKKYDLSYGGSDGCTPKTCDSVCLWVDMMINDYE